MLDYRANVFNFMVFKRVNLWKKYTQRCNTIYCKAFIEKLSYSVYLKDIFYNLIANWQLKIANWTGRHIWGP